MKSHNGVLLATWLSCGSHRAPCTSVCLLAGDAQAKLALIIAQIYLNGERMESVCPSICLSVRDSLSLWETFTAANCSVASIDFFPIDVKGTHVLYIFCLFRQFLIN